MRIWSKITHENVLAFLGFCFFPTLLQDGTTLLSLVSPWMKNGTVVSYVRQHPEVDRLDIVSFDPPRMLRYQLYIRYGASSEASYASTARESFMAISKE